MFDKIRKSLDNFQHKLEDIEEKIYNYGQSDDVEERDDDVRVYLNSERYQRSVNRLIEKGGGLVDITVDVTAGDDSEVDSEDASEESEKTESSSTWDCHNCGKTGNTGKFCPECGTPKQEIWVCKKCGKADNTGKFCTECGSPRNIVDNNDGDDDDKQINEPSKNYDVVLRKVGKDIKHVAVAITNLMGRNYNDSFELLKQHKKGDYFIVANNMPEVDAQELVDTIKSLGGDAFLM